MFRFTIRDVLWLTGQQLRVGREPVVKFASVSLARNFGWSFAMALTTALQ